MYSNMLRKCVENMEENSYIQKHARTHKLLIKKDGHADVDEYNVGCIASLCQQNQRDFAEEGRFLNFLPIIIKMTKKHACPVLVCSMFVHCC